MRIGELLIQQRKLTAADVTRALAEQRRTSRRLASQLVEMGLVEFDDASRALGAQRGVPCVLAKHLAARDPSAARAIPAALGRTRHALPIGRSSTDALVVCARDPSPDLQAALAAAAHAPVTLVIAPASRLEALLDETYGGVTVEVAAELSSPVEEFEVDLRSGAELRPTPIPPSAAPPAEPPLPDLDALDPSSARFSLADLDDVRVTKDPSQSGQMAAVSGARALPRAAPTFDATRTALEQAASRDAATDLALAYMAGQWLSGAVLAIRGPSAVGYRGHGLKVPKVEALVIALDEPSTLKAAIESKRSSIRLYDTPPQRALARGLGTASLAAAPVLVGSQAVAAIVVGEPIQGLGQTERWIGDLGRLAQALGKAYERVQGAA